PYPPRIAIFPSPFGSHAKPIRGAGLKRSPFKQPSYLLPPTVAPGKAVSTWLGIADVPPGPPHCTMPLNGFPAPGTKAPDCPVTEPSSITGEPVLEKAVGSKLNARRYRSR